MTKHENMLLTATEKQIIINYRKTNEALKMGVRAVLKVDEIERKAAGEIISFTGSRRIESG